MTVETIPYGESVDIDYITSLKMGEDGVWCDNSGPDSGKYNADAVWGNSSEPFNAEREIRALAARVEQLEQQLSSKGRRRWPRLSSSSTRWPATSSTSGASRCTSTVSLSARVDTVACPCRRDRRAASCRRGAHVRRARSARVRPGVLTPRLRAHRRHPVTARTRDRPGIYLLGIPADDLG
jgi:hypothetical protein